jgi:hypothetical protein
MRTRLLVFVAAVAIAVAILASCDNEPEQNRSVVSVASINDNTPLFSDVLDNGDSLTSTGDDAIFPDVIPVVFYNRPYNAIAATSPGEPFGDFLITRYTVDWTRTDGGSPALPPLDMGVSIQVPTGEFVEGSIILVTHGNKSGSPLVELQLGGQISMNARIRFYGHEIGTERETEIESSLGVLFADLLETK